MMGNFFLYAFAFSLNAKWSDKRDAVQTGRRRLREAYLFFFFYKGGGSLLCFPPSLARALERCECLSCGVLHAGFSLAFDLYDIALSIFEYIS